MGFFDGKMGVICTFSAFFSFYCYFHLSTPLFFSRLFNSTFHSASFDTTATLPLPLFFFTHFFAHFLLFFLLFFFWLFCTFFLRFSRFTAISTYPHPHFFRAFLNQLFILHLLPPLPPCHCHCPSAHRALKTAHSELQITHENLKKDHENCENLAAETRKNAARMHLEIRFLTGSQKKSAKMAENLRKKEAEMGAEIANLRARFVNFWGF
jgi:hypothetical protein